MTEPDILTPREACGCGLLLGTLVALAVAAYLLCGCSTYTVVAADREVVPVAAVAAGEQRTENGACSGEAANLPRLQNAPAGRRTYVEAEEDATGWYVPDAVMLELLDAP